MRYIYRALGLIYTFKCTESCDICGFSCSSKRKEKMELEDAKRYAREAKQAGMNALGITGGEPFIYKNEIFELIKYARKQLGMYITITSNCFWADSYKNTYKIMSEMKEIGANYLKVSFDEFHGKGIPYENIKNVLEVKKEIGFNMILGCTSLTTSKGLKWVLEKLGQSVQGTSVAEYPCLPYGRAKKCFKREEFFNTTKLSRDCTEKGQLFIFPDGKVYPCGSFCGFQKNRLVGNAKESSIEELVEKAEMNKTNYFISKYGIKPYYDYIKKNNLNFKINNSFVEPCEACYELFNNNDISKIEQISEVFDAEGVENIYE